MDLIEKRSNRRQLASIDHPDQRWMNLAAKFGKFARRFPTFSGRRKHLADNTPGEWEFVEIRHPDRLTKILGPAREQAIAAFKDLASEAAELAGFKGTFEMRVQYWCDHAFGDHIIRKTRQPRRDNERVAIVLDSQGNRRAFRGRQEIA